MHVDNQNVDSDNVNNNDHGDDNNNGDTDDNYNNDDNDDNNSNDNDDDDKNNNNKNNKMFSRFLLLTRDKFDFTVEARPRRILVESMNTLVYIMPK